MIDLQPFYDLLTCHSTPGDEGEVRDLLVRTWQDAGWLVEHHGHYAVTARPAAPRADRPTLLITGHMDSPGFCVERIGKDGALTLIRLGGTRLPAGETHGRGVLKSGTRKYPVLIERHEDDDGHDRWTTTCRAPVAIGDRVCWAAAPRLVNDTWLLSPFIDNRLGCFHLVDLARDPDLAAVANDADLPVNLVLGATTTEEFGGYGASVMATAIRPDLAICLDATYEFPEQGVHMGDGPVATLSDAAILLSPATRDALRHWCKERDLPMQVEAYNYAGTDARAFPHQGVPGPVLAILVATAGNHCPVERCAVADIDALARFLKALARTPRADWPV